jgi:hypothetical protein
LTNLIRLSPKPKSWFDLDERAGMTPVAEQVLSERNFSLSRQPLIRDVPA